MVSVQPERERVSETSCWCCGGEYPEVQLVRLGSHAEVGVCLRCARWLQRRATQRYDEQHPSPVALVRGGIRTVRATVIRRGWHRRGALGAVLRWIDHHLP